MLSAWKKVKDFFTRDLWGIDIAALGRAEALVIRAARFLYIAFREFTEGQLNFRAMSLVYTTLLSLVPLLAVSFSVLKAFGVQNQIEPYLMNFLAPLGPSGVEITRRVIGFVGNMKVGVLGSVGLALLIYTVISLIGKMEGSLNYIWKIKKPRSLARRFSDYMSVLLVGPILIFSAIGLTAAIKSNALVQKLLSIGPLGYAFYAASLLLPYVTTCAAFTFAYIFLPSIKVRPGSALAGGIFAGVIWEVTGWAFASFVASSTQYSAIYSGFAILILFMMWMYWSWLIFLVGGSVSFYYQHPHHLVLKKDELALSNRLKERLAFILMYLIGHNFHYGRPRWTLDSLVERLQTPVEHIQDVLILLEDKGLVVVAGEGTPGYLPARDMETIRLSEILETVRAAGEDANRVEARLLAQPEVDDIADRIDGAVAGALKDKTLKDIVLSGGKGVP